MDKEKVIKGLEHCLSESEHIDDNPCKGCPYFVSDQYGCERTQMEKDALVLLKEMEARIQKYEYVFDFLGIGFRQWATKILDGEAEVICETDEHEYKTVLTFKLI